MQYKNDGRSGDGQERPRNEASEAGGKGFFAKQYVE